MKKLLLPVLALGLVSFALPAAAGCSYSTTTEKQSSDGQTS
ncbi:MAG: hypothetical protein AAF698_02190 [Pseudomonadota bacterium]